MRILLLHCDHAEYRPIKKEIKLAEDVEPMPDSIDDGAVAFVTVEAGDDGGGDGGAAAAAAAAEIAKSLGRIGCRRLLVYPYAHLGTNLAPPAAALAVLRDLEERVRGALSAPDGDGAGPPDVRRAPFGWTKSYSLSVKAHPLAEHSISVGGGGGVGAGGRPGAGPPAGAEAAGAEQGEGGRGGEGEEGDDSEALRSEARLESSWHVMTPDGGLHDAATFDFAGHANLEVLARYEAAKKRMSDEPPPHVALMKRLAIADYEPASDSGNMRFYPNGRLVKSLIERYVTKRVRQYGGYEVETPVMYDARHPGMVSYFNRFPARQYNVGSEGGRHLFLRFAACFGQFMMAHDFQMSHHNLPYRLYELTRYSFRREQSGEVVGLRRLRAFTMPDCHAFCRDMPQAIREMGKRFDLSREVVSDLGIPGGSYEMAVRMTDDFYAEHGEAVRAMVAKHGRPVLVEMWRERFFYFVLKWEFNYIDASGKASALSTDQIDVENGERYGIEFIDEGNEKRHPIILHNSPSGAVERVMYALLEEAAAAAKRGSKPELPLWLSPTQVRVIPVSSEYLQAAVALAGRIGHRRVRVDVDDRAETLGRRIRDAEREWIRFILVVGEREAAMDGGTVRVRDRRTGSTSDMAFDELAGIIEEDAEGKPFAGLNVPFYLSRRPQIMV